MTERIIIGTKLYPKTQPGLGLISALAEEIDGKFAPITEENFCITKQVFIVGRYEEIDSRFHLGELFRIRVSLSQSQAGQSEKSGTQCKYIALGHTAEKLQQNEIVEVIQAELPDRNSRILGMNQLPGTAYILVQNSSGDCFGPFGWDERSHNGETVDIELKFITGGGLGVAGRTKQTNKIPSSVIYNNGIWVDTPSKKKFLVQNIASVMSGATFEEYASDKEIIDYIRTVAGDAAGRIIDRRNLSTLVSMATNGKQSGSPLAKSRIALFSKIVEENAELLESLNDLFDGYLRNEAGIKIIETYIQNNRSKYIDQLKREKEVEIDEKIKRRQDDLRQINEDVKSRQREATRLNDEIEKKRKSLESDVSADQQAYLEKVSKEFQNRIALLNEEEEKARNRIAELHNTLSDGERIAEVNNLIIEKQGALNYLKSLITATQQELSAIREESRKEEDDLRKRLRSLKPYVDHINGPFAPEDQTIPDVYVACFDIPSKEHIHAQRAVIESIGKRLGSLGRSFTDTEVANLLISTQQSFLTLLAGLPGVGKTSLCKLLALAQGSSKRLHNVSVARGWTATKDMIGFHNPLSDRFQPASTGLYSFLKALDVETKANGINAMSYVLLDEANLSSIEHYWSTFMGMADTYSDRPLSLGQESLTISKHLRFLATINYDGTTEPLSPRVLDRASVIMMQPGDITSPQDLEVDGLQPLPISAANMDLLFGLFSETPELEFSEKSALDAINDVLKDQSPDKGRPIYISKRKINAIRQYCGRARSIMRPSGNEITALDWAITQHVLPQVRGHGNKFGHRLAELRKKLDEHGLEMSSDILGQMIVYGQNDLHSYDFFCW